MKYILNKQYRLCGWSNLPYTIYNTDNIYFPDKNDLTVLSLDEFLVLQNCDGVVEQSPNETSDKLLAQGIISEADGQTLLSEQQYRYYDNIFFDSLSLAPTGKCNYNCRHCFMAKDENPNIDELSLDECKSIIEQAYDCGIFKLRITGGEPLVHPNFGEIVSFAKDTGMVFKEVLTNGSLITQELLDGFKEKNMYPLMQISFDGIGCHDWLRGVDGAEQEVLSAIKLCANNGFMTEVHICLHKGNLDALWDTAAALSEMGVSAIRIIRVSEAPRWMATSAEMNLSPSDYFETLLDFIGKYKKSNLKPMLDLWMLLRYFPAEDRIEFASDQFRTDDSPWERMPLCISHRNTPHISYDGSYFPCNIVSGVMRAFGDDTPNIKNMPLKQILSGSGIAERIYYTKKDWTDSNEKCRECNYKKHCSGGCRAIAYAMTHDAFGCDYHQCLYYENGYDERFRAEVL